MKKKYINVTSIDQLPQDVDTRQVELLYELNELENKRTYPIPVQVCNVDPKATISIEQQVQFIIEKIKAEKDNPVIWEINVYEMEGYTFCSIVYIPMDDTMEDHVLCNTIDLSKAPGLTVEFALQRFKQLSNPVIMDFELEGDTILKIKYILHKQGS